MDAKDEQLASRSEMYSQKFELIYRSKYEAMIPVYKYKCLRTGMTIVFGEIEGPMVTGHFALATETHDDDGLPLALGCLTFLGSEDYPYLGALESLNGLVYPTTSLQKVDHACYVSGAFSTEGFLSKLPVYLDSILYPTLKDAGFMMEVYHITGEGLEAGVLYNKIERKEILPKNVIKRRLLQEMYPGKCGYKSAFMGTAKNFRESTTIEKIRKFHNAFYRPENLLLVISGKIDHSSVFDTLEPFVEKILSKGDRGDYVRPWTSPVEPLTKSSDIELSFPRRNEYYGMISIGFRGPSDFDKYIACHLLMKYLTTSPLVEEMINCIIPMCYEVTFYMTSHKEPAMLFYFLNVNRRNLGPNIISTKLFEVFHKLMNEDDYFDMEALHAGIDIYKLEFFSELDTKPHETMAVTVIRDFLYGNDVTDLVPSLNRIAIVNQLYYKDVNFWKAILNDYFINAHQVILRGIPSVQNAVDFINERKRRFEERNQSLGNDGLNEKANKISDARVELMKKPPEALLKSNKFPNIESLKFHTYKTFTTNSLNQHALFKIKNAPIYMEVMDIKTNFVYMTLYINTKDLPKKLRKYLPVVIDQLMSSETSDGIVRIHNPKVVDGLEKGLIQWKSEFSSYMYGKISSLISITIQVEPNTFDRGIQWFQNLLYQTEVPVHKLVQYFDETIDLYDFHDNESRLINDVMRTMIYEKNTNLRDFGKYRQIQFALKSKDKLISNSQSVYDNIKRVLLFLRNPDNLKMHMATDLDVLCNIKPNASSILEKIVPPKIRSSNKSFEIDFDYKYIHPNDKCNIRACAVGVGEIKFSYFVQVADCICDYDHPDISALLVFLKYFTQKKGPIERVMCRLDVTDYSLINIALKPNEKLITLNLYESVNVITAYEETKLLLDTHLIDPAIWNQTLFESAKCSMIIDILESVKSVSETVRQSALYNFKNLSADYNQTLIKKISEVKLEELPEIGKKYVTPLFDPKSNRTAMICPQCKLDDIVAEFKKQGLDVSAFSSITEFYVSQW